MKNKISKRTIALLAAAVVLFSSGGFMASKASPSIQSREHVTDFQLDNTEVGIVENGTEVSDGALTLSNLPTTKKDGETVTIIKPGVTYDELVSAVNKSDYQQYVRMVVRRYWLNADGEKTTDLDPDMIKLIYNTEDWKENKSEATDEMQVWYYMSKLDGGDTTEDLITKVRIEPGVVDQIDYDEETTTEAGKTIYTYHYTYEGYNFVIEAEAQAVQTHNAEDAIKSIWGIEASQTPLSSVI